ncbi:MAG TPA: SxtJ family membrane protein [Bacteroidota bacterium]|nr:SxtJ family membrane protein [Bacteroidota bacterium]
MNQSIQEIRQAPLIFTIARKLKSWWMAFAHALGWLNTRVILTLFYFLVLAIPALIVMLMSKDILRRRMQKDGTYWIAKVPLKHSLEEAKHQF